MNGPTLRVSSKSKSRAPSAGLLPLTLDPHHQARLKDVNEDINKFIEATTVDSQLALVKNLLSCDDDMETKMKFIAAIYFAAEPKHPLKCFLARYIIKSNNNIQELFENSLQDEIHRMIRPSETPGGRAETSGVVSALVSCCENFPVGVKVLQRCRHPLVEYLERALLCNFKALYEKEELSPTDKNEIFTLIHLILRALLNIFQKAVNNDITEVPSFSSVRKITSDILSEHDKDVPLDTKSLCGILMVTMGTLQHGEDYWMEFLADLAAAPCGDVRQAVERVCQYSAVVTAVPAGCLETRRLGGTSGLALLVRRVLQGSERFSMEPLVALSVARTLLSLTKALLRARGSAEGVAACAAVLTFVWAHIEHFTDSVRHLTEQILANILKYFGAHQSTYSPNIFDVFFAELVALPRDKKAYYVGLTASAGVLGARAILRRLPHLVTDLTRSLSHQPLQANVATTINTLLKKHMEEGTAEEVYDAWLRPMFSRIYESAQSGAVDSDTLHILENIISHAIKCDRKIMDFILPEARRICCSPSMGPGDLKCVLVCLALARRDGSLPAARAVPYPAAEPPRWKGILAHETLQMALVHSSEEIRILALSMLIETAKSTEPFADTELELFLYFLRYNINTQSPGVRHLTLSLVRKLMKRLESSYRVLRRQGTRDKDEAVASETYTSFLRRLREQCYDSLLPGANYSRRAISLEILLMCEELEMDDYQSYWCEEYVEKLLQHLEDSYENNKRLSLNILLHCPVQYLERRYSVSLELESVLAQASSVKPPDCVSAAYKLQLLLTPLRSAPGRPGRTLLDPRDARVPSAEPVAYAVVSALHSRLLQELSVAQESVLLAAARGPMYGLLFCMHHILALVDASAIAADADWTALVSALMTACVEATRAVAPIVNNSSPEGHLPMDAGGVGCGVTAQMVLLCAWRTVKEVSLLLGVISSSLHVAGEEEAGRGNLAPRDLLLVGEHFTTLLAETKHRGAFEQAYVGFTKLCARLWRCKSAELHGLPRVWLAELMEAIAGGGGGGGGGGKLCATRRSAGVPFMIQALVTTELQVAGAQRCFHSCMETLLRLASCAGATPAPAQALETRTHCLNILRALYRHTGLGAVVYGYVDRGLVTAIRGFEGTTWAERNSSTLLFSALMVRVFGVQRSKDSDQLCVRNKMTGRTFFLRYPSLYDFMLERLVSLGGSGDLLRPSLYPVLQLLARLYPYTLEESSTNLKLVAFVPHVQACGGSCVLKTRQLAAKALVPLISCDKYLHYLNEFLMLLGNKQIKRNYCHGILLQIIRLLEWKPETLKEDSASHLKLAENLHGTFWILEEALTARPCYITADEYLKLINLLLWRFPSVLDKDNMLNVKAILEQLFTTRLAPGYYGKDVFLANAFKMYLILLIKLEENIVPHVIVKNLDHESYDVVLSALDFILILHKFADQDSNCKFQKILIQSIDDNACKEFLAGLDGRTDFKKGLFDIVARKDYLQCVHKALNILSLHNDTQVGLLCPDNPDNAMTSEEIIVELLEKVQNEHENISHIYLVSLHRYVSKALRDGTPFGEKTWLEIAKVLYESCSSVNMDCKRRNVVSFLEDHLLRLISLNFISLSKSQVFEYHATLWATLVTLLEDDEDLLRQKTSDLVLSLANQDDPKDFHQVIPNRASEILLGIIEKRTNGNRAVAVFLALALLDFNSEVCIGDDISDECRVFDSNEKYNIFLEEAHWTKECVHKIRQVLKSETSDTIVDIVTSIVGSDEYRHGLEQLCSKNYEAFIKLCPKCNVDDVNINPKVQLCIKELCK